MKAIRYHEHGGPDVLRHEEVEDPEPGAGQVLVRVAGAAYNPLDAAIRAGAMAQVFPVELPHVPGFDLSGTVAALGTGVDGVGVGDPVIGFLPLPVGGASAELALAPAEVLTAAPTSVALADAAALPSSGLSAWQSLFELADLQPGQRILVDGAGGGVGGFAVQLAKAAGAFVIATASPRSADAVRAAGADEIVDYRQTSVADAVGEPVDAVLTLVPAGEEEVAALSALVRPGGVLVTTAAPAVGDPEREVRAERLFVRSEPAQLAALVERVDAGRLGLDVSARYGLSGLREVHERSEAGDLRGKVVVTPEA